jgi:hypothetical protein
MLNTDVPYLYLDRMVSFPLMNFASGVVGIERLGRHSYAGRNRVRACQVDRTPLTTTVQ